MFASTRHTGQPESYYHGEGRVALTGDKPAFQYKLTDHLGNTMVLFEDRDKDGIITTESMSTDPALVEVLQRNFYYAFGLPIQGPWNHAPADPDMPYLYNGKELEGELGLGWMDYGARRYDAAIGRWGGVDPLAHLYYGWSSYSYVANNPLVYVDPTGAKIEPASEVEAKAYNNFRSLVDRKVAAYDAKTVELRDAGKTKRADKRDANRSSNGFVQTQAELNELEAAPDIFRIRMGNNLSNEAGGGNFSYNKQTGEVDINLHNQSGFSLDQRLAHELKHAHQFLIGDLDLRVSGSGGMLYDLTDEIEAHHRQNLFHDPSNRDSSEITNVQDYVTKKYKELKRTPQSVNRNSMSPEHFRDWKKSAKANVNFIISAQVKSRL